MLQSILHIIEIILIIVIGLGQFLLKDYVKKKAANLADKEDIETLKTLEEKVSNKFNFENTVESAIYNERKKIIIDLNIALELIDRKLKDAVEKGHHATVEFYDETIAELEAKRKNLVIKRTKFQLYVTDVVRVNNLFAIVEGIVALEFIVNDGFEELRNYAQNIQAAENQYYSMFTNPTKPLDINNPPASTEKAREQCNKTVTYYEGERQVGYSELNKKFHAERNRITPLIKEFQKYCSDIILNRQEKN